MKVGLNLPNSQQSSQLNQPQKQNNLNKLDDSTQEQLQKVTKNNQLQWEKQKDQSQPTSNQRVYSIQRPPTQQSQKLKENIETGRMDQAFFEDLNTKFETTKMKFQPDSCIADLLIDNNTKFREILMKGMIEMAKQKPKNKIRFLGEYLLANAPNIK